MPITEEEKKNILGTDKATRAANRLIAAMIQNYATFSDLMLVLLPDDLKRQVAQPMRDVASVLARFLGSPLEDMSDLPPDREPAS